MRTREVPQNKIKDMIYIGLFSTLIVICSWISIPAAVPFTLQTMAVFITIGLLGGRRGTLSILVYILLGAIGLPVFSGFRGGIGALFGTTGGYIMGFLFTALFMWMMEKMFGRKRIVLIFSMIVGMLLCYIFGTIWFMIIYLRTTGSVGFMTVLGWCVVPFIIPDCIKIGVAYLLVERLKKTMNFMS